jgi:predicted nucleic acid-binding protein
MGWLVLLDAGPLGQAARRRGLHDVERCHLLIAEIQDGGSTVAIPEISDYEVRRELLRLGGEGQKAIERLDRLGAALGLVPITSGAMREAARYWAEVRRRGQPTSDDRDLDADTILAGIASVAARDGDRVIIATGNQRHFDRFDGIEARSLEAIALERD